MRILFIIALLLANSCGAAESATVSAIRPRVDHGSGWWPRQAMPKALVRTTNQNNFPAPRASSEMMVQSVAGLVAKAVNEGRGDEMVWVGTDHVDVEDWFARLMKRHPQQEMRGVLDPWALVERYAKRGIVKGY